MLIYLILISPKLFLDRVLKGKRHPGFLQRIGLKIPEADRPVIWIHAISVGEVKSAQPLFRELKKKEKEAFFLITTTTATGQTEAKRSLSEADAFAYLPLDFSWVVRKWVEQLKPTLFLLVESDFWPNLLAALRKHGTKIVLVSGKLSERSARRFQKFSTFSKKLFSHFDLLCLQSEEHYRRFLPLVPDPEKLQVAGNLKLDIEPHPVDIAYWKQRFPIEQPILTISCTHHPEEELLLNALQDTPWFLILVPRHPERFEEVAQLLAKKNISYFRWSHLDARRGGERVLLVDAMGQLPICYALSRLALVAGSYIDHIGGHNVLEPCLYGAPVIFGPYTYAQADFATRAIQSNAGACIPLDALPTFLAHFPSQEATMRSAAHQLIASSRGSTTRTLAALEKKTFGV